MKNRNVVADTNVHNYLMQPGDGTLYRFGFAEYPRGKDLFKYGDAYILESGVSGAPDEYIWFYINMSSGGGVGCALKSSLRDFLDAYPMHYFNYQKSHGFYHVNDYTLAAILLALGVLIDDPSDVNAAARAMLAAPVVFQEE